MRKTLLTATALAALALAYPAYAASATDTTAAPAATDTTQAPAVQPPAAQTAAAQPGGFIGQQAADQLLASNLIGQAVYNTGGDNLGNITDLVLKKDGSIDAVVLGVGGFLGLGQKSVAVPFASVTQSTDDNGNIMLVLDTTKDALDAAPDFTTLAMIKQKQDQENLNNVNNTAPPAPAPMQ